VDPAFSPFLSQSTGAHHFQSLSVQLNDDFATPGRLREHHRPSPSHNLKPPPTRTTKNLITFIADFLRTCPVVSSLASRYTGTLLKVCVNTPDQETVLDQFLFSRGSVPPYCDIGIGVFACPRNPLPASLDIFFLPSLSRPPTSCSSFSWAGQTHEPSISSFRVFPFPTNSFCRA